MNAIIEKFLSKVQVIKSLKPTYRQPGDGSDGTCDCVGLIIGAIRRMGLKWTGIHGSNWAARKEVVTLQTIGSVSDLRPGDIVFKSHPPGDSKNTLPARYKSGGVYYTGDLNDYYHIGVVTQINPLNITHMTTPTVMVDTKLGKWAYYGRLKILKNAGAYSGNESQTSSGVSASGDDGGTSMSGSAATVTAQSGKTVKMRQRPSTSCGVYENVPIGAKVNVVQRGDEWTKISYGKRTGWYMMSKFLKFN